MTTADQCLICGADAPFFATYHGIEQENDLEVALFGGKREWPIPCSAAGTDSCSQFVESEDALPLKDARRRGAVAAGERHEPHCNLPAPRGVQDITGVPAEWTRWVTFASPYSQKRLRAPHTPLRT